MVLCLPEKIEKELLKDKKLSPEDTITISHYIGYSYSCIELNQSHRKDCLCNSNIHDKTPIRSSVIRSFDTQMPKIQ